MDIFKAANTGNLERVKLLVDQGADKDTGDSTGYTPLYCASALGH